MFWIILGSIIDFVCLLGLFGTILPTGPKSIGAIVAFLIFLLVGIGLIIIGVNQRKNKKEQKKLFEQITQRPTECIPVPSNANNVSKPNQPDSNNGLLVIEWTERTMLYDTPVTVFLNEFPVAVVSSTNDLKVVLALSQGLYRCSTAIFGAPAVNVEIKAGQAFVVRLEYSRASGHLRFESPNTYTPASRDEIGSASASFLNRSKLIASCSRHLDPGCKKLIDLTDSRAVVMLSKELPGFYWVILFVLGLLPGIIYLVIRAAAAKLLLSQLQPDGSVSSIIIRGKDFRKLVR